MDSGKLRALANFVNAVNIGPCIESLKQLHDGSHFVEMMKILNTAQPLHCVDHPIQRYRYILNFLEEFYNIHLKFHIDCSRIINTADEFELAKVASLMLCAAVQGDEDKRNLFVEPITKLDLSSQHEIKDIIEFVLNMDSNSNQLRRNFADILHRRGESVSSNSSGSLNDSITTIKSPMDAPASPFQRVYQGSPQSPVKLLLTSPHVANKINLRKMHQKIRELETKNASERAIRDDLESEALEKNNRIADFQSQLRDLNNKLSSTKDLQDKVDEFQTREDEFNREKSQLQKMKMRLSEFGEIKEHNSRLDKEMKDLTSERTKLHSSLGGYQRLKSEHDEVQKSLRQANRDVAQLKATIKKLNEDLALSESKYTEAEEMLVQCRQIYKEKIKKLEEEISSNNAASPMLGESLCMITEKRISDLEEELNEMSQIREKFETSFKETKALLIKSENERNQLMDDLEDRSKTIAMLTEARDVLKHKVTELEVAIDTVQSELGEIKVKITAAEEQLEQTNGEKRQSQDELVRTKADQTLQLHDFQAHQSAWEAQRTTFEGNERHLKEQRHKLEEEVSKQKREAEAASSDLMGKLAVSSSKFKSLETLLEQERWASNEKLCASKEETIAVRRASEEATKEVNGRFESTQHLMISLRSELEKTKDESLRTKDDAEAAISKAEAETLALTDSVKSERAMVRSIQESHQLERQSWEKTRQDLKDSITKLKDVQAQEKVLVQEKKTALENEISLLRIDMERALSSEETLRASLESQRQDLLAERENVVQEKEMERAELMKQLLESRDDVTRAQAESASHRENFSKQITEAREEHKQTELALIERQQGEVSQLERGRGELKIKLQQSQESLKEERRTFQETVIDLESKNSSLNVDLERIRQENVALRKSLVSDKQEMFAERGRLAEELASSENDLRRELNEVKQSLNRAHSEATSQKEKIEKEIAELKEESEKKEKGLREAYQTEASRVMEANKDMKNQLEQHVTARDEERTQSEEVCYKLKIKLDSLQVALEKERAEKTSVQEALVEGRRETASGLEKASRESQKQEDRLRKDLLETKQSLSKAQSESAILQENLKARERESFEEMERKEKDWSIRKSEEEASRKSWIEKESQLMEEVERLKLEIKRVESVINDKDKIVTDEKAQLKNERHKWEVTKERLEAEAYHLKSVSEDQEGKIGGLEESLEKVTMEKKKLDMNLLHVQEESQLKAQRMEETVSKLGGDLKAVQGELQRSDEEHRIKLGEMMSDMERSQDKARANSELLAERQREFQVEVQKLKREQSESEKKLQERVKTSVKQVGELTLNLREATAIAEESGLNLNEAFTASMELEKKLHAESKSSKEIIAGLESKLEGQEQDFAEERAKSQAVNDDLRTRLMTLELQQEQLQQSSGKYKDELKTEQSTLTKEVEVLRIQQQLLEEKHTAQGKEVDALKCEKLQMAEQLSAHEKEAEFLRSEKQQVGEQQGNYEDAIEVLKSEKQQLLERMNKLIELNKRIKKTEQQSMEKKKGDLHKYKRETEMELEEIRTRYEKEIEITKVAEQAKHKLLVQELDSVTSELEHTKMMLSHETEALEEKSKLVQSTSESMKSSRMKLEKENTSLRKTMDKEKRDTMKQVERLKQELLSVKTESCSVQREVEEETQKKMAEMEKTMNRDKAELETKIQVLVDQNEGLMKQVTGMTRNRESAEGRYLEHSSLEVNLSYAGLQTSKRRNAASEMQSDSLAEDSEADVSSTDSLNADTPAQKLGRNLSEMRLDDLDVSRRASLTSSQGSVRSNISTRSKGRTTIEITMSCTKSQVDLTTSIPANSQTPYNLRSSTTSSQLDLPDKVTKTLDELCASQTSLTASAIQEKSHRTTGRANFVIVNDCDEEPDFLAWEDRIQELHRRNTLCRPHLKTSYPVETQIYAPDNFNDSDLKTKETTFADGETKTIVTSGRTSRKRKPNLEQIDEVRIEKLPRKDSPQVVLFGGESTESLVSHQEMPPPDISDFPKSRTTRSSQNDMSNSKNTITTKTKSRFFKSSDIKTTAENKPQTSTQPTKPDNATLAFDIGFSPKPAFRRRSMRHSFAKKALGRNSPKVNPEVTAAAKKETKLKTKKEINKVVKMNPGNQTKVVKMNPGNQTKVPTGLTTTTAKKSKRRSIGKWLSK